MANAFGRILKIFSVIGISLIAVLCIFLVVGVIGGAEFQEAIWQAIKIIGTITVASILVIFVVSLGNKN